MSRSKHQNQKEEGFILVTSIMLIAILTILGTVSFLKTNVEIKVSKVSADTSKALSLANAGLVQAFVEWGDPYTRATEWSNDPYSSILRDVYNGTNNIAVYSPTLDPVSMADLRSSAASATAGSCTNSTTDVLDNYICWADGTGTNPLPRVYELQSGAMNVVANDTWSSGTNPQVAVWVTGFDEPQSGYQYDNPDSSGAACPTCRVVTYALGRSGQAKRLLREVQSAVTQDLQGVNAITNAPQYATWMDACHNTNSGFTGSALSWSSSPVPDTLVEATQSAHSVGASPSGTAMSSNAGMGRGGKMFRDDITSTSELTMDSTPLIAYSLHNTASGVRVRGADTTLDTLAADDPANKLATDIMLKAMSASADKMDYFLSGNAHLFNMDAYRWAAEQFTCQDPSNVSAANNGAFCAKAEALRIAMGSPVPVTGRLTLEQFEKNVQDGRPMFGIVRVLWPTNPFNVNGNPTTGENCESAGGREISLYDLPSGINKIGTGEGVYHTAGTNSRVVVYGMFLMDYFTDNDNDHFFDADTERLIEPIESVDAYLKIELPLLVNPAVPYSAGGGAGNFYTIAPFSAPAGSANSLGTGNRVNANALSSSTSSRTIANLASPYDGWFPISEGMLPVSSSQLVGSMSLMDDARLNTHAGSHGVGLIAAASQMEASGNTLIGGHGQALFTSYKARLNYYYELMYTTTDQSDSFSWPMRDTFPDTYSDSFCIGTSDCGGNPNTTNHNGDKFHLLFPNGYVHGIKAAMAALNITADEWNNLLSGNGGTSITDLAGEHATRAPYGDATHPLGSPFGQDGTVTDQGIADAGTIMADQNDYFNITEDPTSGYGIIDSDFKDIPSIAYSGGLIDTHSYNNVGGILYTPGPLEWETGNKGGAGYIAGSVITGFGLYNKSKNDDAHQVFVFDPQAVDNISVQSITTVKRRYAWQELK